MSFRRVENWERDPTETITRYDPSQPQSFHHVTHGEVDGEVSFVVLDRNGMETETNEVNGDSFMANGVSMMSNMSQSMTQSMTPSASMSMVNHDDVDDQVAKLLRDNLSLKETLQQNNMAMKHQYDLLLSWQADVTDRNKEYTDKYEEAQHVVLKLREENAELRHLVMEQSNASLSQSHRDSQLSATAQQLQLQNDTLMKKCMQQEAELEQLKAAKSKSDRDLVNLREELGELDSARMSIMRERDTLRVQNASLETNASSLKSQFATLEKQFLEKAQKRTSASDCTSLAKQAALESLLHELKLPDESGVEPGNMTAVREFLLDYGERCKNMCQLLEMWSGRLTLRMQQISSDPKHLQEVVDDIGALQTLLGQDFQQSEENRIQLENAQKQFYKAINRFGSQQADIKQTKEEASRERQAAIYNAVQAENMKTEIQNLKTALEEVQNKLQEKTADVDRLQMAVRALEVENETIPLLQHQIEVYQGDFTAERVARENLAGERDQLLTQVRELEQRLEQRPEQPGRRSSNTPRREPSPERPQGASAVETYSCPICNFAFHTNEAINNHLDTCLAEDNANP